MARLALRKFRSASPRRSNAGALKLARAKALATAARARVRADAAQDTTMVVSAIAAGGLGYLERNGQSEMLRIAGVEPTLVLGVLAGFVVPKFMGRGKTADMVRQVGATSLGIAAYKFGSGQPVIAGDDEVSGGGWPE